MDTEGIILAAGLSSRFPEYKMQMKLGEFSVLERAILSMSMSVKTIYVITGHNREVVEKLCSNYDYVVTVHNENYEDGMFSSIKKGVAAITSSRFFIMPGDYTMVNINTYKSLLERVGDVVIPSYKQKAGHPILLSRKLAADIIKTEEPHLRAFLNHYKKIYVSVSDEGILLDIDTYEDYKSIRGRLENAYN